MATAGRVRGYWDSRDLQGHFARTQDEMQPCPHLCCRNRRVHPERLPVRFDKAVLRSKSEPELVRELTRYSNFTETHPAAFGQIVAEFDRRDRAEKATARRKYRYETRDQEYRDEVYRQTLMAEAATNGYMLSREGKRAGVDPVSLFTGPESRVQKYASPELVEYFESHPRPTRASWFGSATSRRAHLAGRRIGLCVTARTMTTRARFANGGSAWRSCGSWCARRYGR